MNNFLKTADLPSFLLRFAVGMTFFSEGVQKFLFPDAFGTGRFVKLGFVHASFWADFTGISEIICATFILWGLFTRLAAIPLLIIMIVAFITTKYPELIDKGFWITAHDYRTDFAMTLLLIYLLVYGGGNHSIDQKLMQQP